MKRLILTLLVLGTFVILGSLFYFGNIGSENKTEESIAPKQEVPSQVSTSSSPSGPTAGVYTAYSEEAFQNANGKKLLFFHATWCRQCQQIDADIVKNGLPANVNVFKVDYDQALELRKKYGVTLQTTFVNLANDGSLIKKYVAYDEPNLNSVLENAL